MRPGLAIADGALGFWEAAAASLKTPGRCDDATL
jgi:hypothetical protein